MSSRFGTLEERFWKKVDKKSEEECWFWNASKNQHGYGLIGKKTDSGWKPIPAHRLSYKINCGEIETGNVVMHSCDNRSCVNPNHLSQGSYQENTQDMLEKGRDNYAKGENANSKLKRKEVIDIKERSFEESFRSIAEEYDVSTSTIYDIKNNLTWTHIDP